MLFWFARICLVFHGGFVLGVFLFCFGFLVCSALWYWLVSLLLLSVSFCCLICLRGFVYLIRGFVCYLFDFLDVCFK